MYQWMFGSLQGFYRLIKHAVDQLGIWACPNRPTRQESIEAIYNRGKINLPSWNGKLRYVSKPFDIRLICMEIPHNQIFCSGCAFTFVGTVFHLLFPINKQVEFLHDSPYNLFRNESFFLHKQCMDSAIPISLTVFFKQFAYVMMQFFVLVRHGGKVALVAVTATCQLQSIKQFFKCVFIS